MHRQRGPDNDYVEAYEDQLRDGTVSWLTSAARTVITSLRVKFRTFTRSTPFTLSYDSDMKGPH